MLGKLYPTCLEKYVRSTWRREVLRYHLSTEMAINIGMLLVLPAFWLDIKKGCVYNYEDISGGLNGLTPFTPTQAPSADLERTGCHPPAPASGDRSIVPRQRLLRSERSGAGEIRDAPQCPGRGASGGGCSRDLWPVPSCVLRHPGTIQGWRLAGSVAAQAWTEATAQAQRRDARCAGAGRPRGRTDAQGGRASCAFITALWSGGTPAHHSSPSDSVSQAAGKKR
jgi:hypothetical protein